MTPPAQRKPAARKVGHTSDHGPLAGAVRIPGVTLPGRVAPVDQVTLDTPLRRVIEEKYAKALSSVRGIETVEDLLWFFPSRFTEAETGFAGLRPGHYLVTTGVVVRADTKVMRSGRPGQQMLTAVVKTSEGLLNIVFFTAWGHVDRLKEGVVALFQGTVTEFNGQWQIAHPLYDILTDVSEVPPVEEITLTRRLIPIYRDVKGMPPWSVGHCAQLCVQALDAPEALPAEFRQRHGLPTFAEAMRMRHLPVSRSEVGFGRRRLAYDEALAMQLVLAERRRDARAGVAISRTPVEDGLLARFDQRLPFELTEGQKAVGRDITDDLASVRPMNRLLQGEVGSGKTLVALRAMLAVVDAGGQCALLAPTEVLAAQHHRSITAMLGDLAEAGLLGGDAAGTRVTLLTGSLSTAARKKAMLEAASGEAGIVVGTHALLAHKVSFAALGLVVVDEQHRFGVEQRDALRAKGEAGGTPHLLVMTATPIPRTVAMTVFGDMDVSTMRELPRGRSPISTHVVDNLRWYDRTWARVAEEVAAGHQAYVVCPRIDASDDSADAADGADLLDTVSQDDRIDENDEEALFGGGVEWAGAERAPELDISDLSAVDDVAAELAARPDFEQIRVGILHGRLPAEEKDAVMTAFAAGELDVLVSTTVIEVGVDVANATVMVVMNADRFGVSQLHQLRGRVGRGSAPGLCLLVTRTQVEASLERVRAVAALTDGFALADVDLAQRREGDILGARQSGGRSALRVLRLAHDEAIIASARTDAEEIITADPGLSGQPLLRQSVLRMVDDDAAEFLTRG